MSKLIFTILAILVTSTLFGQKDSVGKIKRNEDLLNFIHSEGYSNFELIKTSPFGGYVMSRYRGISDGKNSLSEDYFNFKKCKKISDSLGIMSAIQVEDFDKNGIEDMLVIGETNSKFKVFAILNFEENKKELFDISRVGNERECSYPLIIENVGIKYIYKPISYLNKGLMEKRLVYKFGNFIEENNELKEYEIQKIKYWIGDVNSYSQKLVDLSSTNLKPEASRIKDLLCYIDFPELESSFDYGVIESHGNVDPIYLKLFFDNDKTKVIRYRGNGMHDGIDRLIKLIEEF